MAGSSRCFLMLRAGLFRRCVTRSIVRNQSRMFYSAENLGMVSFVKMRDIYRQRLGVDENTYREELKKFEDDNNNRTIFTEDLKMVLSLASDSEEDIEMVCRMVKKYNKQSDSLRFGTFTFGPVVMRYFHQINKPKEALHLLLDPELRGFFEQITTHQIALDLLYSNGMYAEMRQLYEEVTKKLTMVRGLPYNCLILVSAGLYKENTPESMDFAIKLWQTLNWRGSPVVRRMAAAIATLAVNQGKPDMAVEILATCTFRHHMLIRSILTIAYVDLDRPMNLIQMFRNLVDTRGIRTETICLDAFKKAEKYALEKKEEGQLPDLYDLICQVKERRLYQDDTVDDMLSATIHVKKEIRNDRERSQQIAGRSRDATGAFYVRQPNFQELM